MVRTAMVNTTTAAVVEEIIAVVVDKAEVDAITITAKIMDSRTTKAVMGIGADRAVRMMVT